MRRSNVSQPRRCRCCGICGNSTVIARVARAFAGQPAMCVLRHVVSPGWVEPAATAVPRAVGVSRVARASRLAARELRHGAKPPRESFNNLPEQNVCSQSEEAQNKDTKKYRIGRHP